MRNLTRLSDMAQEELANAFSCLKRSTEGPSNELMRACAEEYFRSVHLKCVLATEIAHSMVHIMHGNKDS